MFHHWTLAANNGAKKTPRAEGSSRLVLCAATAADLMTSDPVWIRPDATVKEAAAFLADKHVGAVPVLDEEGRPVGVLSKSDILLHSRELVEFLSSSPGNGSQEELGGPLETPLHARFKVVDVERTRVRDVMTATIYSVTAETPVTTVIEQMQARRVHRLFVVSETGVLVGIISTFDVLGHLRRDA
jgi:CBS domain-containing protein